MQLTSEELTSRGLISLGLIFEIQISEELTLQMVYFSLKLR